MTPFQKSILKYVRKRRDANTWEIARDVFPERWTKAGPRPYSGRGALIGHIDRAASQLPDLVRLPPKDRYGIAEFWYLKK